MKKTYSIDFDLDKTKISYMIKVLCDIGDFTILQNKYYLCTSLSKQKLLSKLKSQITDNEQVLIKQVDDLNLFVEDNYENKAKSNKKITYEQASKIAIDRINVFLDDVYTELKDQIRKEDSFGKKENCAIDNSTNGIRSKTTVR